MKKVLVEIEELTAITTISSLSRMNLFNMCLKVARITNSQSNVEDRISDIADFCMAM